MYNSNAGRFETLLAFQSVYVVNRSHHHAQELLFAKHLLQFVAIFCRRTAENDVAMNDGYICQMTGMHRKLHRRRVCLLISCNRCLYC